LDIETFLKELPPAEDAPKYSLKSVDSIEEDVRKALLKLLERSSKSSGQLRTLLLEKEFPVQIVDQMIERFIEVGLIDDLALAKDFTEIAVTRKSKAKSVIARELRAKHFPQEAIDAAISEIDSESELDAAKKLAETSFRQLLKLEPEVRTRRLSSYLMRKGYSSSVVWAAVRHASGEVAR
jgi:regulatory protein